MCSSTMTRLCNLVVSVRLMQSFEVVLLAEHRTGGTVLVFSSASAWLKERKVLPCSDRWRGVAAPISVHGPIREL